MVSYRIKIRMTEELVDMAQRLGYAPDKELELELSKMKELRN